ncbi:MAG: hypothetical protein SPK85_08990, partial [Prevotella sp.]|nr:hypothetical protein [Prevotella sp.]
KRIYFSLRSMMLPLPCHQEDNHPTQYERKEKLHCKKLYILQQIYIKSMKLQNKSLFFFLTIGQKTFSGQQ